METSCGLNRPELRLDFSRVKDESDPSSADPVSSTGNLSPNPQNEPSYPLTAAPPKRRPSASVLQVDQLLLFPESASSFATGSVVRAFDVEKRKEGLCKVYDVGEAKKVISTHCRIGAHPHINVPLRIVVGKTKCYVFYEQHFGDLHAYIRNKAKRLSETEARNLFRQVLQAVEFCHANGIIVRDLKLRNFVFADKERTTLKLDSLDGCFLTSDDSTSDIISDKHACPAYVSPEILSNKNSFSGKAADTWSLGVILFTMLVGRYPFHDRDHHALFEKIRRCQYYVPESLSARARCLIQCLLRQDPSERLEIHAIYRHPWMVKERDADSLHGRRSPVCPVKSRHRRFCVDPSTDQVVPSGPCQDEN